MPRARTNIAGRRRHKKLLARAKGFRASRGKRYRIAKETVLRAMAYATRDRRARKRTFRALWITRLNAAARAEGLRYSELQHGLTLAGIQMDRKRLSELAIQEPDAFRAVVARVREALEAKASA